MVMMSKAAVLGVSAMLLAFSPLMVTAQEQKTTQIEMPERDRYLNELKARYRTQDERTALLAESNKLLADYALTAAYQVGKAQDKRENLNYQLSLGSAGELLVREERHSVAGTFAVRNQSVELFGIEASVRYDCATGQSQSCVLFNPKDGNPWLTIVRNQQGAQQLSKALSFLIRNLQKG